MASTKIQCAECKKFTAHILIPHLVEEHKMTASEYVEKYPDEPIASDLGRRKLSERLGVYEEREKEEIKIRDVFPGVKTKDTTWRFKTPGPWTPKVDPKYVFPPKETICLLMALSQEQRNRAYIQGPTGTGKSMLVQNVAALLNWEFVRVNYDSAISRSEQLGDWVVRGKHMSYMAGLLPQAMWRGCIYLADEFDCINPHSATILRPVLEDPARLVLLENGGQVIDAVKDFRFIATGNTWGRGDDTGNYSSTNVLTAADRQRFSMFIQLDYLAEEKEREMLKGYFPDLEDVEVASLVAVANDIRTTHKSGRLDEGFSPRQLINWAEKYTMLNDVVQAAKLTFLNSYAPDNAIAVSEAIQRHFPNGKTA